jgi:methionyl-tRNA formyltransferase
LRIHQACVLQKPHQEQPGTILSIDKQGISVATGEQTLLIERLQFPGGKAISVADWLNAHSLQLYVSLVMQ